MKTKKAQVWVETVLYTVVGLAIISIVLAFMIPKINQTRDRITVEQSIDTMKIIDSKIQEISKEAGSRGQIQLKLKRGDLIINASDNSISIYLGDLDYLYSEPGYVISEGKIKIVSQRGQNKNSVMITSRYDSYNLTYNGLDSEKKLNPAASSYLLTIENMDGKKIDIRGG